LMRFDAEVTEESLASSKVVSKEAL
jgi:hypothetical protein